MRQLQSDYIVTIIKPGKLPQNYNVVRIVRTEPGSGIFISLPSQPDQIIRLVSNPRPTNPNNRYIIDSSAEKEREVMSITFRKKIPALTGVKDIDYIILENLGPRDIIQMCRTNVSSSMYCQDENLWIRVYQKQRNLLGMMDEIYMTGNRDIPIILFKAIESSLQPDHSGLDEYVPALLFMAISYGDLALTSYIESKYTIGKDKQDDTIIEKLLKNDFNTVVLPMINWIKDSYHAANRYFLLYIIIRTAWYNANERLTDWLVLNNITEYRNPVRAREEQIDVIDVLTGQGSPPIGDDGGYLNEYNNVKGNIGYSNVTIERLNFIKQFRDYFDRVFRNGLDSSSILFNVFNHNLYEKDDIAVWFILNYSEAIDDALNSYQMYGDDPHKFHDRINEVKAKIITHNPEANQALRDENIKVLNELYDKNIGPDRATVEEVTRNFKIKSIYWLTEKKIL